MEIESHKFSILEAWDIAVQLSLIEGTSLKFPMPWRGPHQWHSNIQASLPSSSSVHLQEFNMPSISIDTVTMEVNNKMMKAYEGAVSYLNMF